MEHNFFSWTNLLEVALFLALWYAILYFFRDLSKRTSVFGTWQKYAERIGEVLLLFYEPFAAIMLVSAFVFINPLLHGSLVLLLAAISFRHLQNYVSGRIIRFDKNINPGKKLSSKDVRGIIFKERRLGLEIKTGKGLQFVGYQKLLKEGYMLLADEEIGGFYRLRITPEPENKVKNHKQFVRDLLISAPYPDRNYPPEFSQSEGVDSALNVQVTVREKNHLEDLLTLIRERGYGCKVLKK